MDSRLKNAPIKGPSRKRLLTDSNPNQTFVTASPESTVSSDSSSDRLAKKTRELPNLSDCHSCGVRINFTNPRERLQPLDSMWRVVLLCKKCYKLVISSELCSYCFLSVTDENDCFKCIDCNRSMHKECVAKYGSGLGFSVCVDCWIPDAVANSIMVRKRKHRKKDKEPETSESGVRKVVVAKNAGELAKGVMNVVESGKVVGSCETKVVDDAEFAFKLHRAISSSPRMSRYGCLMSSYGGDDAPIVCYSRRRVMKKGILVNSSSLDVPLICYYRRSGKGGLRNSGSLDVPLKCYSRRRSRSKDSLHVIECECYNCKVSERNNTRVSTSSARLKASNCGSNSDNSLNGIGCPENDGGRIDSKVHRYLLKYYRIGKGVPRPSVFVKASDCGSSVDFANVITEDMSDTGDFENGKECHEICEKCDDNANRFLFKYKRSLRTKPKFSCEFEDSPLSSLYQPKESTTLNVTRLQSS